MGFTNDDLVAHVQPDGFSAVCGEIGISSGGAGHANRDDALPGSHNTSADHIVGADGCDDDVVRLRLHNGAACGQAVCGGACGRCNHNAVAAAFHGLGSVALHGKMHDSGNRPLGNHRIVQTDIVEDDIPVPLNHHIQHHPLVDPVISCGQLLQPVQLRALQLRHKAHGADVDAQHGNAPPGGGLGHMQDGSVAAEADHHIRVGQLPVQPGEMDISGKLIGMVHLKGQAYLHLKTAVLQDLHGIAQGLVVLIPIGIGGKN